LTHERFFFLSAWQTNDGKDLTSKFLENIDQKQNAFLTSIFLPAMFPQCIAIAKSSSKIQNSKNKLYFAYTLETRQL